MFSAASPSGKRTLSFDFVNFFRNFTLQQVLLPLSDVTKSFQKEPEKTQQAVHRVCVCVSRMPPQGV